MRIGHRLNKNILCVNRWLHVVAEEKMCADLSELFRPKFLWKMFSWIVIGCERYMLFLTPGQHFDLPSSSAFSVVFIFYILFVCLSFPSLALHLWCCLIDDIKAGSLPSASGPNSLASRRGRNWWMYETKFAVICLWSWWFAMLLW